MVVGFIGLGNMASAIIRGLRACPETQALTLLGRDKHPEKAQELGLKNASGLKALADAADVLVLAVKPQALEELLTQLAPLLKPDTLLISIAAGKPLSFYEIRCPDSPVIRAMPNINAGAGASVTALCCGALADEAHLELARLLFAAVGSCYVLPESQFSIFGAIGGAAPAYTYLYIDAVASAAVRAGMPRATALAIATDMAFGSAKLLRESGEHPHALADKVCSPGGTTIEGVHRLRALGFESAVYEALAAVIEKDRRLGSGR